MADPDIYYFEMRAQELIREASAMRRTTSVVAPMGWEQRYDDLMKLATQLLTCARLENNESVCTKSGEGAGSDNSA